MNDGNPIIVKRKKVQPAAHHGGSWKVAYADFVTAMMAFFMVMWIMGMSQETRSMVAGYFNDPLGFMKNQPKSRSPFAIPGSPVQKFTVAQKGPNTKQSVDEELELKRIEGEFKSAIEADVDLKALKQHVEIATRDERCFVTDLGALGEPLQPFGFSDERLEADGAQAIAEWLPLPANAAAGTDIDQKQVAFAP